MKYVTTMTLLSLTVLSFLILSNGCAYKDRKDSFVDETVGVLHDKGQGVCLNVRSGRMWQIERGGKFSSLKEAEQYAVNLQLGGYDDWRLPTKTELFDLYYIFFWKNNGDCSMKRTGEYWAFGKGRATLGHWETYLLCAPNHKYVKSLDTKGYVRAVRQ